MGSVGKLLRDPVLVIVVAAAALYAAADDPRAHRVPLGRTGQDLLVGHLTPGRRPHLVPDAGDAEQ